MIQPSCFSDRDGASLDLLVSVADPGLGPERAAPRHRFAARTPLLDRLEARTRLARHAAEAVRHRGETARRLVAAIDHGPSALARITDARLAAIGRSPTLLTAEDIVRAARRLGEIRP